MAYRADLGLGPEWAVLELLCRGLEPPDRRAELERLIRRSLNWGDLLDHALRHRMLTMLARAVVGTPVENHVPRRICEHLRSILALNLYRRESWFREVARVTAELEERGIAVAARKSAAYEPTLYGGDGSRWLGDIDLLIEPDDAEPAARVLEDLGYERGLYDEDTGSVVPFTRAELMRYRLNPDHLPTYSRATGDPLVWVLEVDCATSLTWARAPYHVPVGELLTTTEHLTVTAGDPVLVPCLPPLYQFLDTVLHLFREAWFEWWLDKEQDVDLMKFGDVIRLWQAHESVLLDGSFRQAVERYGVVEPVCWVLEHLDRTFRLDTVAALGLDGRVSEAFLASAAAAEGTEPVWRNTMRERLHAKDRRLLIGRA